eukprot:TRINITY_DN8362_c0_g1_i1.p1 TRINITY_DN8362_c0_g1~~TRINITY_DN8362_c0_g1_i1.p1  ORF type:complete len:1015 (+),score=208.26 TRINITY_DN8362_c0_g1_i1:139-3183(+)
MDQYELLQVLGRGSFGVAHLVRGRNGSSRGRHMVMKEINLACMPAKAQKEATAEASVLRSLSHVNVIAYYDTFSEGSKLCIVMEFADDGDLSADVRRRRSEVRRFNQDEAVAILIQCCLALQHIHGKHVLHRDLKCQNIFMSKGGVVKLGDFGIAKVLDCTGGQVETMIGTPTYMPPEVCNGMPYGIKADVWSLGVVFYELLALEQPFQGSNVAALVLKIITSEPKPLPDVYCSDARSVAVQCLQKLPEKRPKTDDLLRLPVLLQTFSLLPQVVLEDARLKTPVHVKLTSASQDDTILPSAGRAAQGAPTSCLGRWPQAGGLSPIVDRPAAERPSKARKRPSSGSCSARRQIVHVECEAGLPVPEACVAVPLVAEGAWQAACRRQQEAVQTPRGGGMGIRGRLEDHRRRVQGRGGGCGKAGFSPQPPQTPQPAVCSVAEEFRRNREHVLQMKDRALGELQGRPLTVERSCAERGDKALKQEVASSVRERAREAKEVAEEQHRQALMQAAAQARVDRKVVQQKLQGRIHDCGDAALASDEVVEDLGDGMSFLQGGDLAAAARQRSRSQAAKEAQRRQRQTEMEDARRQREMEVERARRHRETEMEEARRWREAEMEEAKRQSRPASREEAQRRQRQTEMEDAKRQREMEMESASRHRETELEEARRWREAEMEEAKRQSRPASREAAASRRQRSTSPKPNSAARALPWSDLKSARGAAGATAPTAPAPRVSPALTGVVPQHACVSPPVKAACQTPRPRRRGRTITNGTGLVASVTAHSRAATVDTPRDHQAVATSTAAWSKLSDAIPPVCDSSNGGVAAGKPLDERCGFVAFGTTQALPPVLQSEEYENKEESSCQKVNVGAAFAVDPLQGLKELALGATLRWPPSRGEDACSFKDVGVENGEGEMFGNLSVYDVGVDVIRTRDPAVAMCGLPIHSVFAQAGCAQRALEDQLVETLNRRREEGHSPPCNRPTSGGGSECFHTCSRSSILEDDVGGSLEYSLSSVFHHSGALTGSL